MARRKKPVMHRVKCKECGRTMDWAAEWETVPCCGQKHCVAMLTWTQEKWVLQASMAQHRVNVGLELTDVDREAFRRTTS